MKFVFCIGRILYHIIILYNIIKSFKIKKRRKLLCPLAVFFTLPMGQEGPEDKLKKNSKNILLYRTESLTEHLFV